MLCHLILISSSPEVAENVGANSESKKPSDDDKGTKDLNKGKFKKFLEFPDYRDVIVHLHDWPYTEIAKECPSLREFGYAAVQISPVTTYAHSDDHPWDERLNVINYDFENESGNEDELGKMIKVCNKNNIKVFVDVVINHMARSTDANDKGEKFEKMVYRTKDGRTLFMKSDFHEACDLDVDDYTEKKLDYNTEDTINTSDDKVEVHNNQGGSVKEEYYNKIKALEKILEFYKAKRNKKEFDVTSFLIDHTKKEVLWTCMANSRHDLRQVDDENKPKKQILDLFQHLIFLGVSGFRILLADHMNPDHLHKIYDWFPQRPLFIYHDVYDPMRHETTDHLVHAEEYAKQARVTDYRYARLLSRTFLSTKMNVGKIFRLQKELDLLPSEDSVVFVNNFITLGLEHRGIGYPVLEDSFIYPGYDLGKKAVMLATSFMLIHDHGIPLITSSYKRINGGEKEYVKEHSWNTIKYMVQFRNVLKKHNQGSIPPPDKYKEYSWSQSSYCVGSTGFVAYNNENPEKELKKTVDTCFESDGEYCDIFGGGLNTDDNAGVKPCKGNSMVVSQGGKKGELKMAADEGLAAFHIDAMVPFRND